MPVGEFPLFESQLIAGGIHWENMDWCENVQIKELDHNHDFEHNDSLSIEEGKPEKNLVVQFVQFVLFQSLICITRWFLTTWAALLQQEVPFSVDFWEPLAMSWQSPCCQWKSHWEVTQPLRSWCRWHCQTCYFAPFAYHWQLWDSLKRPGSLSSVHANSFPSYSSPIFSYLLSAWHL